MEANFPKALGLIAQGLDDMAVYLSQANFLAAQASVATILQLCQTLVAQITMGSTTALAFPSVDKLLLSTANAVQVFVYDTRLDDLASDGQRWNEPGRCSHLSYWHEAQGVYRGVKRDCPAVALIVALREQWYIFDGLDLDPITGAPRLWAASNPTGNGLISCGSSAPITSVYARNGYIYFGTGMGLHIVSLTGDWCERYDNSGRRRRLGTFVQRNTVLQEGAVIASAALPATGINSVHAAVLPCAPLDAAGMPIPTVVATTAGGTAVLHPGGQVVAVTRAQGHSGALLEADGTLTLAPAGNVVIEEGPVPYATVLNSSWRTRLYDTTSSPATLSGADKLLTPGARGSSWGLEFFARDAANPSNGMVAFTKIGSATGWLPGDIRLATLCDAATGPIAGSGELAVNGGFDTDTAWTKSAGWSIGGGVATKTPGASSYLIQQANLTGGLCYAVTFTVTVAAGSVTPLTTAHTQAVGTAVSATGTYTQYLYPPSGNNGSVEFYASADFAGTVDNVSIRLAVADRSPKGKGLIPYGTLQRNPVATGSDVVAWSGFSGANYLEQPYNSDLDFGTGDWWIEGWVDIAATGTVLCLCDRGAYNGSAWTGAGWRLEKDASEKLRLVVTDDGYATTDIATGATPIGGIGRVLVGAGRRGGVYELSVNDRVDGSTPVNNANLSLSNPSATLRVGGRLNGGNSWAGSVSMLRFGAYAPTPAQIRRMYTDEAPLMQAGAKAMLGGIGNNVASLSRDPLTGRLAAGTGDGVSVFSGLRRVSYLDEAVLAATTSDTVRSVSLRGGNLLIGTAAEVGFVGDAIGGKEAIAVGGPRPVGAGFIARGLTTDGAALDLVPRVPVGERETVMVEARFVGRVTGAVDTERLTYVRRATYYRDASGAITLQGTVQTGGMDTEVTGTADATLAIVGDWVSARVTGVSGKRIRWEATITVTRISEETSYAA
ncbi:hypothetical protein D2T81_02810 [Azospirillum brasilense]|nr:hypothetical protein D2T81_02810 [Azospirillum brasilense]